MLDFLNDADTIREAFADYYRATILADETDPNKLHDLQADLDRAQVYSEEQVDELVRRYLGGEDRDRLDPILDACVAIYRRDLFWCRSCRPPRRRRHRVPQRAPELRPPERPYRARQGVAARDDRRDARRHRAVQAVHGQRQLQALAQRHCVRSRLRADRHATHGWIMERRESALTNAV